MQSSSEYRLVELPCLGNVELCPVSVVQVMIKKMLLPESEPLFIIKVRGHKQCLTARVVRKGFPTF